MNRFLGIFYLLTSPSNPSISWYEHGYKVVARWKQSGHGLPSKHCLQNN